MYVSTIRVLVKSLIQSVMFLVIFLCGTDVTSSAVKPDDIFEPRSTMSRTVSYAQIIKETQGQRNSFFSKSDCQNFLDSNNSQINICNMQTPDLQICTEQYEEDEIQLPESPDSKTKAINSLEIANAKEIRKKYAAFEKQVQSYSRNQLMIELCEELEAIPSREIKKAFCYKLNTQQLISNYKQAQSAAYFNMYKKSKGWQ